MYDKNKNEYNVYIDESGDEGINKGSKIFYFDCHHCNEGKRFRNI